MIPTVFNGMIAILLARFILNDVPHALELLPPPMYNSMEEYQRERKAARIRGAIRIVPPTRIATVYHVTHRDNLSSIMKRGLLASETSSGMLFFFPTLEYARESGLTDMAILAVVLIGGEIDKCEIGEIFPDLYEERFGGQPPADMSLRSYLEHPVPYGVPEVSCTIVKIPPDRVRYVEVISRG